MEPAAILPITLGGSLLVAGLTARWYVLPRLDALPWAEALTPLLLLHSTRYLGLLFLVPGVVSPRLTPAFAVPAAYGDLLAAVLALLALAAVRRHWAAATPLVWIFNVAGTLDLLYAIAQGTRNNIAADLGAAYYIPAVVLPALLTTHALVFRLLLRAKSSLP